MSDPSSRISATVHRTVAFDGSNPTSTISPKAKRTPNGVRFAFVISVHFRYRLSVLVPARFVAVLPKAERKVSNPSSRIRATSHWGVAFNGSNLSRNDKKRRTQTGSSFFGGTGQI